MSFGPEEMITGPSRNVVFDLYWYIDRDLSDEIAAKILEMYDIVLVEESEGKSGTYHVYGTQVDASYSEQYGIFIDVVRFPEDGMYYATRYYLSLPENWAPQWERTFTQTAFGDEAMHNYLVSFEPDAMITGPSRNENYDVYWYWNRDISDEVVAKIQSMYYVVYVEELEPVASQVNISFGTQVETAYLGKNCVFINVNRYSKDGMCQITRYYMRVPEGMQT
jgi:hypothetical protein